MAIFKRERRQSGGNLFFKALVSIVIVFCLMLIAGLSSVSFQVWPTGLNDYTLTVTPALLHRLHSLQSERKFDPDSVTFYPGAVNEGDRRKAQEAVDSAIEVLIKELPEHPRRSMVLRTMKVTLSRFDTPDSEDRDQMLVYLTRVMEVCGVNSSGELFNVWRYGFPYGWFLKGKTAR